MALVTHMRMLVDTNFANLIAHKVSSLTSLGFRADQIKRLESLNSHILNLDPHKDQHQNPYQGSEPGSSQSHLLV